MKNKPVRKGYLETHIKQTNIDDVAEIALANSRSLSKYDKYKLHLNVIDIISLYAWSVPLMDKNVTSI